MENKARSLPSQPNSVADDKDDTPQAVLVAQPTLKLTSPTLKSNEKAGPSDSGNAAAVLISFVASADDVLSYGGWFLTSGGIVSEDGHASCNLATEQLLNFMGACGRPHAQLKEIIQIVGGEEVSSVAHQTLAQFCAVVNLLLQLTRGPHVEKWQAQTLAQNFVLANDFAKAATEFAELVYKAIGSSSSTLEAAKRLPKDQISASRASTASTASASGSETSSDSAQTAQTAQTAQAAQAAQAAASHPLSVAEEATSISSPLKHLNRPLSNASMVSLNIAKDRQQSYLEYFKSLDTKSAGFLTEKK